MPGFCVMLLKIGTQDSYQLVDFPTAIELMGIDTGFYQIELIGLPIGCLLYTSDAADE